MRFSLENIDKKYNYLLAISGGLDSMVLLDLFIKNKIKFSIVHCNFQLRGNDSVLDEKLVTEYCKNININFFVKKFETLKEKKNRQSVEMIARDLRYNYFNEIMTEYSFDFLVTAHHLNDNIETFFINLSRGSGLKGLSSMKFQSEKKGDKILRPLLKHSRNEILKYATENKIEWREDITNQSLEFVRNKIRHKVIPIMEEINIDFLKQADKSISIINQVQIFIKKQANDLLNKSIIKEYEDKVILDRIILNNSDFILTYNILSEFGFSDDLTCKKILNADTGKYFENDEYKIWIDRNTLIIHSINHISDKSEDILIENFPFEIDFPFKLKGNKIENFHKEENTEIIDLDKISFPLTLRKWKKGDYFYPINGNGKKKISKYLKDEKISSFDKRNIYVLCNSDEKIIWIVNHRLDDRFKTSEKSKLFLRFSI